MGISAQQLLQSDPEFLQRQLAQQEMQRLNPAGTAAGAIGALLGRGIGNVSAGRGFFDINDAGLRRVRDVQGIMSQTEFNPNDPAAYYETIAKSLQQAGYGDLAPMALQQATTLRREQRAEARAVSEEARRARELELRDRQVMLEEVTKDPYGSIQRALAMPEDSPLRQTILAGASARIGEKNVEQHIKTLEAQRLVAQTEQARAATTAAAGGQAVTQFLTTDGKGLIFKNGKYYRTDTGAEYTDKLVPNRPMTQAEALAALGAQAGPTPPGTPPKKDRRNIDSALFPSRGQ